MRHLRLGIALAVVVVAGCTGDSPVQPPRSGGIDALISDGSSNGNDHFFFLPPLVPNPSALFDAGTFNSHLSPFVEVCELAADPRILRDTDCRNASRVFGPARMTLDDGSEQYHLNWDTNASSLLAINFYRIIVRGSPNGTVLGFVDVDPVLGGIKNLKTGDVILFQDGRTLPIKVRIEIGAFGSGNASDRVEQVVPNLIPAGFLDVTTNTGFAGARFPNDWLPLGFDQVVVIIERVNINRAAGQTCLSSGLVEMEGCYRFRTDPDLHSLGIDGADLLFRQEVIAGVCFEIPEEIHHEGALPFTLHRREEINNEFRGAALQLRETDAPFLRCDGFGPTRVSLGDAFRSGGLAGAAKAGLSALARGVGHALQPRALHAVDFGAGGGTSEFSRFGWARRDTMTVAAGSEGQTAPTGSVIQASVQITTQHHGNPPVADHAVTFTIRGGGGTLVTPGGETNTYTTATDGQGYATVSWRLGQGENTLEAATSQVVNSPVFIHATGTGTPDLTVQGLEFSPATPTTADVVTVSVTVANQGTGSAPSTTANLCIAEVFRPSGNETSCMPQDVPPLARDQSVTLTARWAAQTFFVGAHQAFANVDQRNLVTETNEDNNSTSGPQFDIVPFTLTFERLPNGEPTCGLCEVTNQFAAQGVEFAYEDLNHVFTGGTLGDGTNILYGDPVDAANHFITSKLGDGGGGVAGVLTMTLHQPYPHTVIFDWSTPTDVTPQINVFEDGSGTPLPEANFSRTTLRTYLNNAGEPFIARRVMVNSDVGIQRLVFIMTSFIQQIDNVQLVR
jgi:hypothetical protein